MGAQQADVRWTTPLAMGPQLSAKAKERLDKMERLDLQALISACQFPVGVPVAFHDEPGAHDPCYVVLPGGAMLELNHWGDELTDVARAVFIVRSCNAALGYLVGKAVGL